MISSGLYALLFWAIFALFASNLYGALKDGVIYIRNAEYRATKSRAWFWMAIVVSLPLTLMSLGMALLCTLELLGLRA